LQTKNPKLGPLRLGYSRAGRARGVLFPVWTFTPDIEELDLSASDD